METTRWKPRDEYHKMIENFLIGTILRLREFLKGNHLKVEETFKGKPFKG